MSQTWIQTNFRDSLNKTTSPIGKICEPLSTQGKKIGKAVEIDKTLTTLEISKMRVCSTPRPFRISNQTGVMFKLQEEKNNDITDTVSTKLPILYLSTKNPSRAIRFFFSGSSRDFSSEMLGWSMTWEWQEVPVKIKIYHLNSVYACLPVQISIFKKNMYTYCIHIRIII